MNPTFKLVTIILLVALAACGIRGTRFGDTRVWVPKNNNAYSNRAKFDSSVFRYIDTGVVYEDIGVKDNSGLHFRWFKTYEMYNYGILRFYPNGFLNLFVVYKDPPWSPKQFDPDSNGARGIYYKEGNNIKGECFAGGRRMKKHKMDISVSGDTLFITWSYFNKRQDVYVKKKLPPEFLKYRISDKVILK
jgi:hypothetical protein